MSDTTSTEYRLTIAKQINAPIEDVFDAWIVPEIRKQWWRATPDLACDVADIDARPGGRYRINMKEQKPDDPKEYVCVGEFVEIDRPNKLVFTWGWEQDVADTPGTITKSSLVTLEFRRSGDGTEITVTHVGFPTQASRDDHEKGWTGCLEALAETAEKLFR